MQLVIPTPVDIRGLAALRRRLGLTQAQLAERVGCRAEDVSRWERACMEGELGQRIASALLNPDAPVSIPQ